MHIITTKNLKLIGSVVVEIFWSLISPRFFYSNEFFELKLKYIIKDILADGCRFQLLPNNKKKIPVSLTLKMF